MEGLKISEVFLFMRVFFLSHLLGVGLGWGEVVVSRNYVLPRKIMFPQEECGKKSEEFIDKGQF